MVCVCVCVWLRQKHFNLAQFCHRSVLGNSVMEGAVTKEHGGCMRARKARGIGKNDANLQTG